MQDTNTVSTRQPNAQGIRVLADHGVPSRLQDRRLVVPASELGKQALFRLPGLRAIPMIHTAGKLWWAGLRERGPAVYVTIGSGHGTLLALLQWMSSPLHRRRSHVFFDLLLERRRPGLLGAFDRAKLRLFRQAVDAAVVWGEADVEIYSREYQIPREKFRFKRFHITLEDYEFDLRDDGYIFAGGNHGRDYRTLIEALGGVDYPVFIATQAPGIQAMAAPYPNITVRAVTPEEFRQKMAASTLVVEAHPAAFFRTAGHQTFLNAMWMGKAFVMADRKSALGYFEHGKEWLVVESGDVLGLRQCVQRLLDDRAELARIAAAGQSEARRPMYGTLECMKDIYDIAIEIEANRHGIDPRPSLFHPERG